MINKDPKRKIIGILCPHCKKNQMFTKNNYAFSKETYWLCPDCVYAYNEDWFNTYDQFEGFVRRE